ncbi:MAG TPA: hypothetical protein VKQ70_00690 [Caulobacteraceae bacterium]|jgi:hypothetical protein|nr:hypothetical protein [Caulobacteraceae bacterium]
MKLANAVALTAALALAACNLPVVDKQSDGVARTFFDEVRSGADLGRDAHVDASLQTPIAAEGFARIRSQLPPGAPTKVNNTGFSYRSSSGVGAVARLSHQYLWAGRTVTIQTFMKKPPGGTNWFVYAVEADLGGAEPAIVVGTEPASDSSD